MQMSVAEVLERFNSRELGEWMAYDRIQPFGDRRADLRAALVACTISRTWGGKGQIKDFLLDFKPEPPSEELLIEQIKAINKMLGGSEK